MAVYTWTEIESFHNIRKYSKEHPEILNGSPVVYYKAKVKLHGTNAGIQCHADGRVIAQSRTSELVEGADNAGFAKWVKENENAWRLKNDCVIYGEWIGPGIQKGVAVSEIPKKSFAVFAARSIKEGNDSLTVEPAELENLVAGIPDTYVLPWYNFAAPGHIVSDSETIALDWSASSDKLIDDVARINTWVERVEGNDPWVQEVFNVKGTGEGLVFYPYTTNHSGLANFNNLVFKAKGEKHKNIKTAAPAQVDASIAASVGEFIELVLTDARLEQGATAVGGFDLKLTGKFIAWIEADVKKETQDELEASNLDWKLVAKDIARSARTWYIAQSKIRYLGIDWDNLDSLEKRIKTWITFS